MTNPLPNECALPPTGWRCTRDAGHEGPCAAVPTFLAGEPEFDAAVDAVMERFHAPAEYAERVVRTVVEAMTNA